MKNLKLLVLLVFILGFNSVNAQLQKGNLLIGGQAGFNVQFNEGDDSFSLSMNPNILALVSDNFALGGSLGFTYSSFIGFSNTAVGFLPQGRLYLPQNDKMAIFLDAQIGLQFLNINFNGDSESETVFTYAFGPGIAYFISDDVSIDTGLSYNYSGGDFDRSSLNLTVGIQVFLTRKDKE